MSEYSNCNFWFEAEEGATRLPCSRPPTYTDDSRILLNDRAPGSQRVLSSRWGRSCVCLSSGMDVKHGCLLSFSQSLTLTLHLSFYGIIVTDKEFELLIFENWTPIFCTIGAVHKKHILCME